MKKKALTHAVFGACLLQLAALPLTHAANDWTPQLLVPPSGTRGPVEPIRIRLPRLPNAVLQRLTLEFDDFDVTALVTRDGTDAVFTPPQAIPFGPHQLRLVEYAEDGSVIERGAWEIDIRKTALLREAELRVASTLNAVQRIAEDDLPANAPDNTQGNGAAQFAGVIADGDWRMQANMDLFYNSQANLLPRNKHEADVGHWLVRGDVGPVTAAAGHHSVAPDSMAMQAFNRRGVSLGAGRETDVLSATAFSLRTEDVIGAHEGLGLGDSDNRTDGVNIIGRPLGDVLLLSATYLDGEGPTFTGATGTGVVGQTFRSGGRSASLVADGNLIEKRLRLRGEYATSRYDFDGLNTGSEAEKDKAYSALATYAPWQEKIANGMPLALQVGLENKRIGTFFRSPANPIGVSDRDATRGFAGFAWGGLNMQMSLGQESDNVNDIELLPRTEITQGIVSVTYTPTVTPAQTAQDQPPAQPWYGQPLFNLTWLDLDQDVTKATSGLTNGALHATRTLSATASFAYPTWTWSLNHTIGKDDDFANFGDDTDSSMTQLSASLRVGDKLTIGPSFQRSEIENRSQTNRDSSAFAALLNLGYAFSERINANLSYSVSRQKVDDSSFDSRSNDLIGAVNWLWMPPQGAQPGVAFALEGQYHDLDDRVFTTNNQNNYQIFLKASLSWSPTY